MKFGVGRIMIVAAVLGLPVAVVAAESGVEVVRGTAAVAAAEPSAAGRPAILRGQAAAESWRAGTPRSAREHEPSGWITTGGETLWLVERHGDGVVGCWLQGSGYAGENFIRCAHDTWR